MGCGGEVGETRQGCEVELSETDCFVASLRAVTGGCNNRDGLLRPAGSGTRNDSAIKGSGVLQRTSD